MVDVDLVHDVEDLVLRGVAAERAHQDAELLRADETVAVLEIIVKCSDVFFEKKKITGLRTWGMIAHIKCSMMASQARLGLNLIIDFCMHCR